MVLPADKKLVHETEVVGIIEARDHYKKEEENEKKRAMRARKEVDADAQALRDKLENDRKEKEAEGPVTQGSKRQELGTGQMAGCKDVGIGQNKGG